MADTKEDALVKTTQNYYDSTDADNFYFNIWGGEDIHVGIYDREDITIREASHQTVKLMADMLQNLNSDAEVLDIGAGYGGAGRFLAKTYGCKVVCQNLSETQNARNREMNKAQGLEDKIEVIGGNFEDLPLEDGRFDIVWCEDSILHSGRRKKVLEEVFRVLKTGGEFIFTDPMKKHGVPNEDIRPILNRIHLDSLGSFEFYQEAANEVGFETVAIKDLSEHLGNHYAAVAKNLNGRYDEVVKVSSKEYVDNMLKGLDYWVEGNQAGNLTWGILHFRKPKG